MKLWYHMSIEILYYFTIDSFMTLKEYAMHHDACDFNIIFHISLNMKWFWYMKSYLDFIFWNHEMICYMKSYPTFNLSFSKFMVWNNIKIPCIWFQWYDFISLEIMKRFHIWNLDMISWFHIEWFHVLYMHENVWYYTNKKVAF